MYSNGDVVTKGPGMDMISTTTAASTACLHETIESAGALVGGRRIFDCTKGWGGKWTQYRSTMCSPPHISSSSRKVIRRASTCIA